MISFTRAGHTQDSICAVSTPPGVGGISVVRLSGAQAEKIIRQVCGFLPGKLESHRVYYGIAKAPGETLPIDEVVVTWFAEGRSFTGENTAEISCHGSPHICDQLIKALIQAGARVAERGEFTFRAFHNGRIDLVQAEGVLSLIESTSAQSSRLALRQLQGDLSESLTSLEDGIIWALAHIEAGIDFSTENLEVVDPTVLLNKVQSTLNGVNRLLATYKSGRVIKEGLRIVLAGEPNVGKSSLLNLFIAEKKAIVTPIPGTTRDVVEGETSFAGQRVIFFDTAGVRDTLDEIERIGIEKTKETISLADHVLWVIEAGRKAPAESFKDVQIPRGLKASVLVNKAENLSASERAVYQKTFEGEIFSKNPEAFSKDGLLFTSALDPRSRDEVLNHLIRINDLKTDELSVVLTQNRHFEFLTKTAQNLEAVIGGLNSGLGPEFVALELKEALIGLQQTLGKHYDDQILDRVFKEFCIGK